MKKINTTKKVFCETHPAYKRLRKTDPKQFEVKYNLWVIETYVNHIKVKRTMAFLHTLQMAQLGLRY